MANCMSNPFLDMCKNNPFMSMPQSNHFMDMCKQNPFMEACKNAVTNPMDMLNKNLEMMKSFDMGKNFDAASWMPMMSKGMDLSSMFDMWTKALNGKGNEIAFQYPEHMKGMDMFSDAQKLSMENGQAVMRRQAEIIQRHASELFKLMKDMSAAPNPESSLARQTDYARSTVDTLLNDFKELTEMFSKANLESFEAASNKMNEHMEAASKAMASPGKSSSKK